MANNDRYDLIGLTQANKSSVGGHLPHCCCCCLCLFWFYSVFSCFWYLLTATDKIIKVATRMHNNMWHVVHCRMRYASQQLGQSKKTKKKKWRHRWPTKRQALTLTARRRDTSLGWEKCTCCMWRRAQYAHKHTHVQ